jgi:hypothetical protein
MVLKAKDVVPKLVGVASDFRKIASEKDIAVPGMPSVD